MGDPIEFPHYEGKKKFFQEGHAADVLEFQKKEKMKDLTASKDENAAEINPGPEAEMRIEDMPLDKIAKRVAEGRLLLDNILLDKLKFTESEKETLRIIRAMRTDNKEIRAMLKEKEDLQAKRAATHIRAVDIGKVKETEIDNKGKLQAIKRDIASGF